MKVIPQREEVGLKAHPRAGSRAIITRVLVGGQADGTCDELSLSIGWASEEEMKKLQEAQTISLVRRWWFRGGLADRMIKTLKEE